MWLLKGSLLGVGLFVVGTLLFMFRLVAASSGPNTAIGLTVITGTTIHNPWFWVAFVACIALGLAITASWPRFVR